ncbi:oxidoreductase [Paenibacillus yonginensis]|uniref:Oxidoreductase n=2 Tax=Paenibacillus yonginensis TaxID=1462996 RepID=A0A1B1N6V0_9BACL|nr:SDR family oxidoreductase [Paenibacillus yonginensis]ANS77163.1 oxidoreductase [Paenibacillus yonginensis]
MRNQIEGKVIVITGASSGIGEATAKELAQQGGKVVLAARREERLQTLTSAIQQAGGEAVFRRTDVTSRKEMEKLAEFALEQHGRIDVLVNNAGIMPVSRLSELRVSDWERMIDVNIKGVLYGIAAVLPAMKERQAGHIINVASVAGHEVSPTSSVYSATKFAVRAITEGLRQEESTFSRIRSTIISPGITDSELLDTVTSPEVQAMTGQFRQLAMSPEATARAIAFAINEPEEVGVNEIILRPTAQP